MSEQTVLTADGDICVAGEGCSQRVGLSPEELRGRNLRDICPLELVEEILPLLRQHAQAQTPFLASLLFGGVWSIFYFTPCASRTEGEHLTFNCFPERDWRSLEHELHGVSFYKLHYRDLGPLSAHTTRELEILKLIGDGLTSKQMSQLLHRSERTIQGHRISLGKKLGCATKADLARVATDAGLPSVQMEDLSGFLHESCGGLASSS